MHLFNTNSENDYLGCKKIKFYKNLLNKQYNNYSSDILEHIDDSEYNIKEQEIKYKIFDDISSITKQNENIEIILDIPKNSQIISINKIKLSKNINNFVNDIYISLNNKKITKEKIYKNNLNEYLINNKLDNNSFKCHNNISLHIIINSNSFNEIINNNIYVTYSYANYKNKNKIYLST